MEVLNTDAEGRLILGGCLVNPTLLTNSKCFFLDALSYAEDVYKPHTLIDVATLTGAISTALGTDALGAFTNSDELWLEMNDACNYSGDICWRMPLYETHRQALKSSDVADLKNIAGSPGASIGAAFLSHFVAMSRWIHLDIAGIDYFSSEKKGYITESMSGAPTRALIKFALNSLSQKKTE